MYYCSGVQDLIVGKSRNRVGHIHKARLKGVGTGLMLSTVHILVADIKAGNVRCARVSLRLYPELDQDRFIVPVVQGRKEIPDPVSTAPVLVAPGIEDINVDKKLQGHLEIPCNRNDHPVELTAEGFFHFFPVGYKA